MITDRYGFIFRIEASGKPHRESLGNFYAFMIGTPFKPIDADYDA